MSDNIEHPYSVDCTCADCKKKRKLYHGIDPDNHEMKDVSDKMLERGR